MKRVVVAAAVAIAMAGCGGGGGEEARSSEASTAPVAAAPQPTSTQVAPATTTAAATPATPDAKQTAVAFEAAYRKSDWATVCSLYSPSAIAQLVKGAADAGSTASGCEAILIDTLGQGMTMEPLDVSGNAVVDGDVAKVGEVRMVRTGGEWKVDAGG